MFEFKEIDKLSPSDFELFVKGVFSAAGWTDLVVTKPGSEYRHGDGGVDIFGKKGKKRFAIEVKHRSKLDSVTTSALNQLVTGAKLSNVNNLILVTNSYFTSEVRIRATRLGVELIDRERLHNLWEEKHSEVGRSIKPRQYQQAVINEIISKFETGKKHFLIEMATGLGKTYTAGLLVKEALPLIQKDRPAILFIAHQIEILIQSVTSFKNIFGIGNYTFSACFDGAEPEKTDFIFATFDTLLSKLSQMKVNKFDIIIVDEAHHTPASTYTKVVEHFQPKLLVGMTATPFRSDNKNVNQFFGGQEGHIGKYDLPWGLKHKKLAFPKYTVLLDDLDQSKLEKIDARMDLSDIDRTLFLHKKDEEIIEILEKTIIEKKITNPKAIVFCKNINHIKYLIHFFTGDTAIFVHSKMSGNQRRENIRSFREGKYKFILVCDLFNEGIDIPETNVLVFLRNTTSHSVWLQQLGRGLRKTKNKDYVHVLDFVGSIDRLFLLRKFEITIDKTPLDVENLEPEANESSTYHDSTIEVEYNIQAAQVLKLIEKLKYKLVSKSNAIETLQIFWEDQKKLPPISNLIKELESISYDQISTHFNSYYGYVLESIGRITEFEQYLISEMHNFVSEYYATAHIIPSAKAISIQTQTKGLVLYTEIEINLLSDNLNHFHKKTLPIIEGKAEALPYETSKKNESGSDRQKLLTTYSEKLSTHSDLLKLTNEETSLIKKTYPSLFQFLKDIEEYKNES